MKSKTAEEEKMMFIAWANSNNYKLETNHYSTNIPTFNFSLFWFTREGKQISFGDLFKEYKDGNIEKAEAYRSQPLQSTGQFSLEDVEVAIQKAFMSGVERSSDISEVKTDIIQSLQPKEQPTWETVFRKYTTDEHKSPKREGQYDTGIGNIYFDGSHWIDYDEDGKMYFIDFAIEYWFEKEIPLNPSTKP